MVDEPRRGEPFEPPPEELAPWEPWVWYGTFAAGAGVLLLRLEQANTHSHGVRLLVSTLMLILSLLILTESVFVLLDIRGVLWKISGRPAEMQLKLGSERKPWDGRSPRMWCGIFAVVGLGGFGYGISGLVPGGSAASRAAIPEALVFHGRGYYLVQREPGMPYCLVPPADFESGPNLDARLPKGYEPFHPLSGRSRALGERPILRSNGEPDSPTPARVFIRDGDCFREYTRDAPRGYP